MSCVLANFDALLKAYYTGDLGASRASIYGPSQPWVHPRDERGWLICGKCGTSAEYAEPPESGSFICGECRALRDG